MYIYDKNDILNYFNWYNEELPLSNIISGDITQYTDDKEYFHELYDKIYHFIHGLKICDLVVDNNPLSNTLLMMTAKNNQSLSSYSINYKDFVDGIGDIIINNMRLGSMAFEQSANYSLTSHDHDYEYNKLSVEPKTGNDIKVCEISTSTGSYDIYSKQTLVNHGNYYIGQLKFLYRKSKMKNIDIESPDFDGWVYPDGREYDIEKFPELYEVLQDNKLPDLDNLFIKFSNSKINTGNIVDQHIGIIPHTHTQSKEIQASISIQPKIDSNFKGLKQSTNGNSGHNLHTGSGNISHSKVRGTVNVDNLSYNISCSMSGNDQEEYYPTHYEIPVMMYIGKPQV